MRWSYARGLFVRGVLCAVLCAGLMRRSNSSRVTSYAQVSVHKFVCLRECSHARLMRFLLFVRGVCMRVFVDRCCF